MSGRASRFLTAWWLVCIVGNAAFGNWAGFLTDVIVGAAVLAVLGYRRVRRGKRNLGRVLHVDPADLSRVGLDRQRDALAALGVRVGRLDHLVVPRGSGSRGRPTTLREFLALNRYNRGGSK